MSIMKSYNNASNYNNIVFIFLSSCVCNIIMTLYPIPEKEKQCVNVLWHVCYPPSWGKGGGWWWICQWCFLPEEWVWVIASEVCLIPTFAPGWGRWGRELIGALSLNQQSYSHGAWFIARTINRDYLRAAALWS